MAVAMPVTMLVAPGPEVATATPTSSAGARIAVRHVRGALLVAHQHVMDLAVLQRVIGRQNRAARIAENVLHAFALQTLPKNARPGHCFLARRLRRIRSSLPLLGLSLRTLAVLIRHNTFPALSLE